MKRIEEAADRKAVNQPREEARIRSDQEGGAGLLVKVRWRFAHRGLKGEMRVQKQRPALKVLDSTGGVYSDAQFGNMAHASAGPAQDSRLPWVQCGLWHHLGRTHLQLKRPPIEMASAVVQRVAE